MSFVVGDWLVEPHWNRICRGEETVKLEPRVMRLLVTLAAVPDRPLQRQELLDTVWPDTFVNEEALSRAVSQLRRAFGDDAKAPRYLQTVHKGGYCLIAPVRDTAAHDASHASPVPAPPSPHGRGGLLAAAIPLLLLVLLGGLFLYRGLAPSPQPIAVRPLVPLTSDPGREIDPALSPDGSRVAYLASTDTGYDVFVRGMDGGAALRLTHDTLAKGHLTWSPNGDRVAFVAADVLAEGGTAAIYVLPLAGGGPRKLVDLPSWSFGLDWSPDGRTLAYADAARGEKPRIVLFDIQTRSARPISQSSGSSGDVKPVFSPDGARLAFLRNDALERQQVVLVDLPGGGEGRPLSPSPQQLRGLDWAPDGASVIVSARSGRKFGLWRLPLADNAAPEPFPTEGGELFNPSVSRNGLIVVEEVEQDRDVWSAGFVQSDPTPLIRSTSDDFEPSYGPGASGLAFVSERSGAPEIWLQPLGGEARKLTNLSSPEVRHIVWSPDGAKLGFTAEVNGVASIYTANLQGGEPARLPGIRAGAIPVGWAAGADALFLLTPAGNGWRLEEYSIPGHRTRPLDVPPVRVAAVARDGKSLVAVPVGEDKLLHIVSGKGVVHQLRLPSIAGLAALLTAPGTVYLVEESLGTATVHRLDLRTGAAAILRKLEDVGGGSIALAPDGRSLAFTRSRETANDLALIRL